MYSLHKFANRTGRMGQPLPDPYPVLGAGRIRFRHGGTSLIAGTPGSYKSIFALNLVTKWAADHSILYFSADSDEFTVAKRLSSILTDHNSETVDQRMTEDPAWRNHYQETLVAVQNAKFVYQPLEFETIQDHLAAFDAVHGDFPEIVFIDNLIDTVDDPTDFGGMIHFIKQMDVMSRKTGAHVCILHHASESWSQSNPGMPPPSSYIQGKVNQIPRLVLTVAAQESWMRMACVKNSNGPQDPTAQRFMSWTVQPSLRVDEFGY